MHKVHATGFGGGGAAPALARHLQSTGFGGGNVAPTVGRHLQPASTFGGGAVTNSVCRHLRKQEGAPATPDGSQGPVVVRQDPNDGRLLRVR